MNVLAVPLMLLIFTMVKSVRILEHPETRRVPEGGSVTFECSGEGEMGWFVDDQFMWGVYRTQLQQDGFSFRSSHYPTYSDLTMTAPAKISRNGTQIKCEAYSTSEVAFSNTSWLWIIGPPLPPNVTVELSSWNTMRLTWSAPFTADGFPIDKYIVFTTNSSTGERTRTEVYPTDGNESLTIVDTPRLCHSLLFEVTAESSAGTSSSTEVSGAFPVAVTGFHVDISVTLTVPELVPEAKISFQPPQVCAEGSGVAATYTLELRTVSGVLVYRTAAEYHESILIEETQTVVSCSSYTLNVTVSVPSFPFLGTHSNITMFHVPVSCPTPASSSTTSSTSTVFSTPSSGIIRPPTVGSLKRGSSTPITVLGPVAGVLMLLVGAGVGGVVAVFVLRRRRITAERQTIHRPLPPMSPNPIYESSTPLYDVIPDNLACKLQADKEMAEPILPEDSTRYATTPLTVDQLLDREDSGISEPLSKRQWEEERTGGGGETEREDCYILMQSCAEK